MALIQQKKQADQPSEKESISINTAFKEMVKEIQKDLEEEEYQADIGGSSAFRSSSVTDAASPNSLKESKKQYLKPPIISSMVENEETLLNMHIENEEYQ